jgi:hypothetical protein
MVGIGETMMDPKVTFVLADSETIGNDIGPFRAYIDAGDGTEYGGLGSSHAEALFRAARHWRESTIIAARREGVPAEIGERHELQEKAS